MTLTPADPSENPDRRRKIISAKNNYGTLYGAFAGLAFASAAWGVDGLQLSQAHALYPWLKFILGCTACVCLGGLAGRISAQLEKGYMAVLIWLSTSGLFSWLSLIIPFEVAPSLVVWLKPELRGLLNYNFYQDFQIRFGVTLAWALIFGFFVGLLQLVMTESAVFSTSIAGKLIPLSVCAVLMAIAGSQIDTLNNQPLRSALASLDAVIQFAREHRGQVVDSQVARQMHLSTMNSVTGLIERPYRAVVSSYDDTLGEVDIIVEFGNTPVHCVTVYGQPIFCEKVTQPSP